LIALLALPVAAGVFLPCGCLAGQVAGHLLQYLVDCSELMVAALRLERSTAMAVTAFFQNGHVTELGDALDNTLQPAATRPGPSSSTAVPLPSRASFEVFPELLGPSI
jgi:hypothetical protein